MAELPRHLKLLSAIQHYVTEARPCIAGPGGHGKAREHDARPLDAIVGPRLAIELGEIQVVAPPGVLVLRAAACDILGDGRAGDERTAFQRATAPQDRDGAIER